MPVGRRAAYPAPGLQQRRPLRNRSSSVRLWPCVLVALCVSACTMRTLGTLEDLASLPQDAGYYRSGPEEVLIEPERQSRLTRSALARFYEPWDRTTPRHAAEEVFRGLERYRTRRAYGENNLPLSSGWLEAMRRQSRVSAYPGAHVPAITVVHASMRVLPTHKPVFHDPPRTVGGFPLDRMQNTLVPAGTPLLITHWSLDGQWALCETEWAAGWIRWRDVARVDRAFMASYRSAPLAGFLEDHVPVLSRCGRFLLAGRVGMALPLAGDADKGGQRIVRVPVRDPMGQAGLVDGVVNETACRAWPFPATTSVFVRVLNALLGQRYGWGGVYENRDCSALMRDVFAGFGVFLPRNSKDQGREGRVVPLEGMKTHEKERTILTRGKSFLTLLYMPGHVMLYLGQDPVSGRAVAFHAMWGLRTVRLFHRDPGRWVIGRTVITSLEPGKEGFPPVPSSGLILEQLTAMALLD